MYQRRRNRRRSCRSAATCTGSRPGRCRRNRPAGTTRPARPGRPSVISQHSLRSAGHLVLAVLERHLHADRGDGPRARQARRPSPSCPASTGPYFAASAAPALAGRIGAQLVAEEIVDLLQRRGVSPSASSGLNVGTCVPWGTSRRRSGSSAPQPVVGHDLARFLVGDGKIEVLAAGT